MGCRKGAFTCRSEDNEESIPDVLIQWRCKRMDCLQAGRYRAVVQFHAGVGIQGLPGNQSAGNCLAGGVLPDLHVIHLPPITVDAVIVMEPDADVGFIACMGSDVQRHVLGAEIGGFCPNIRPGGSTVTADVHMGDFH